MQNLKLSSREPVYRFQLSLAWSILGWRVCSNEGPCSFSRNNNEIAKFIHETSLERLGQFQPNFVQMCLLIRIVFSGEWCRPCAYCFILFKMRGVVLHLLNITSHPILQRRFCVNFGWKWFSGSRQDIFFYWRQ